jgi:hypothetical protein
MVMAIYRPKEGKSADLDKLVRRHYPVLKEYGLATERAPFIGRSAGGAAIEVFEWVSSEAARKAHDHPAVAQIWEAMAQVCDFGRLGDLPEAAKPFPQFGPFGGA